MKNSLGITGEGSSATFCLRHPSCPSSRGGRPDLGAGRPASARSSPRLLARYWWLSARGSHLGLRRGTFRVWPRRNHNGCRRGTDPDVHSSDRTRRSEPRPCRTRTRTRADDSRHCKRRGQNSGGRSRRQLVAKRVRAGSSCPTRCAAPSPQIQIEIVNGSSHDAWTSSIRICGNGATLSPFFLKSQEQIEREDVVHQIIPAASPDELVEIAGLHVYPLLELPTQSSEEAVLVEA